MFNHDGYGLVSTHWALGSLILVGLASSELTGGATIIALPITALATILAATCEPCLKTENATKKRKLSDIVEFIEIWLNVLELLAAAATCARIASATMDYMSRGRFRDWLFGIESHSLGEPWPDVIGVTIMIVTTGLFMLGLDKSPSLCILLYFGLGGSFVFFVVTGSFYTDTKFWSWTKDFNMKDWKSNAALRDEAWITRLLKDRPPDELSQQNRFTRSHFYNRWTRFGLVVLCLGDVMRLNGTSTVTAGDLRWFGSSIPVGILTASALCTFAFPNTIPHTETKLCLKYAFLLIVPIVGFTTIILVFTLMSHFREIAGTAIPLVRVFEMRDVDWARPIMATCTIFVACIALTEIMPAVYSKVMLLASREWRMLVSSLLYRNPLSGAPVLAIFTVGSLASILAFACPLSYLVRLLNVSPLLKCALRCSRALYERYKIESVVHEDLSVQHNNIQYSRLHRAKKSSPMGRIKKSLDMVPRFLRNNKAGNVEDKEYLLMGNCSNSSDKQEVESQSDSSDNAADDEAQSSSSTDIDAVVQEFKDQIQVTTVNTFADAKGPSRLTSRTVLVMIGLVYVLSSLIASGIILTRGHFIWPSCIGILLVIGVVLAMPQNRPNLIKESSMKSCKGFLPWAAITSILVCIILAALLLVEVWFGVIMWIFAGLVLFCRCDCCTCEGLYPSKKERLRLQGAPKPENSTFRNEHTDRLDTVLMSR